MAPETIQWVREMFSPARLYVMYGQTEATARLAYLPPEDAERKRGSVGIAIPGVELRVAGDDGRTLPVGEVGQLVARGPNVCLGYLGDEEATARILRDGWLWTGDLAVCDPDGYFTLCGRADELMKVGGYRVSPVGIEHVLQSHPDVVEAAVVGRPDSLMGTVPVAFVVARAGTAPADADLRRWAQERLPSSVNFPEMRPGNCSARRYVPSPAMTWRRDILGSPSLLKRYRMIDHHVLLQPLVNANAAGDRHARWTAISLGR
jgi:acyl-coenzyme A synthetase/AMP-(fatty) acid ligase